LGKRAASSFPLRGESALSKPEGRSKLRVHPKGRRGEASFSPPGPLNICNRKSRKGLKLFLGSYKQQQQSRAQEQLRFFTVFCSRGTKF
jgi:hypothetical protein